MDQENTMATRYEHEIPEGYEARIEGNKVILEPKESEDEGIRKDLITFICQFAPEHLKAQYVAYLEKRKDNTEKEYVFRSLAGTDITIAAKHAIERAKDGDHLVLAFNGMYTPVSKYDSAKGLVDKYNTYLEEQQSAEWSEEDEYYRNQLIVFCENCMQQDSEAIRCANWLKSLRPQPGSQPNINHTVWHNASEEKPTKLPIIHIWYHGNRVNAVTHEDTCLQAELDDINFQPDDKWAYVEDLLNAQPHWKPSVEHILSIVILDGKDKLFSIL